MEDDYKVIKLENNLQNLNKDIVMVNDEIEQIKKLLFFANSDSSDNLEESQISDEILDVKKRLVPP